MGPARVRRRARRSLPIGHAVALGFVQGPAELLPISSSGHVLLLPALLRWPYEGLDPRHRKAFEVALHTGTAAGLAIVLRGEVGRALGSLDGRRAVELLVSTAPPALVGLFLRDPVEERLSRPRPVALAQAVAGMALLLADRRPAERGRDDAGLAEAVAVGVGQAVALAPGVSRGGAALTALRWRRLERPAAALLARHAAAPLMLGVAALQVARLVREGLPRDLGVSVAAGVASAFASTVACSRLVAVMDAAGSYAPLACYRIALGGAALVRLRKAAG